MRLETDKGKIAMLMGCPMGAADFATGDFTATHPESGETEILFGIDPTEAVELTVVNEYDQEVTQTFQAGVQPYLFKKIKQDATETIVVNYFI
jgi:DNA primase